MLEQIEHQRKLPTCNNEPSILLTNENNRCDWFPESKHSEFFYYPNTYRFLNMYSIITRI